MKYQELDSDYTKLGYEIIGAAFDVRKEVGTGMLEGYYEGALSYELANRGIENKRQVLLPALYKGVEVGKPYRMDLFVADKVVIECKAVHQLSGIELAQLATYMRLANIRLGYVINFWASNFHAGIWNKYNPDYDLGIVRVVN